MFLDLSAAIVHAMPAWSQAAVAGLYLWAGWRLARAGRAVAHWHATRRACRRRLLGDAR